MPCRGVWGVGPLGRQAASQVGRQPGEAGRRGDSSIQAARQPASQAGRRQHPGRQARRLQQAGEAGRGGRHAGSQPSRQAGRRPHPPTRDIKVLAAASDDQQAGDAAGRQRGQLGDEGGDRLAVARHQLLHACMGARRRRGAGGAREGEGISRRANGAPLGGPSGCFCWPPSSACMRACVPNTCPPTELYSERVHVGTTPSRLACMRASRIIKFVALVSSSTSRVPAPTSSASWMLAACAEASGGRGGRERHLEGCPWRETSGHTP